MQTIFYVAAGSCIGGVFRYLLSAFVQRGGASSFPYGTLLVNISGCFLMGIVLTLFEKGNISEGGRLFLATGILGGFTTFSAFSGETIVLLKTGQMASAIIYVLASIVFGIAATALGFWLMKV